MGGTGSRAHMAPVSHPPPCNGVAWAITEGEGRKAGLLVLGKGLELGCRGAKGHEEFEQVRACGLWAWYELRGS